MITDDSPLSEFREDRFSECFVFHPWKSPDNISLDIEEIFPGFGRITTPGFSINPPFHPPENGIFPFLGFRDSSIILLLSRDLFREYPDVFPVRRTDIILLIFVIIRSLTDRRMSEAGPRFSYYNLINSRKIPGAGPSLV